MSKIRKAAIAEFSLQAVRYYLDHSKPRPVRPHPADPLVPMFVSRSGETPRRFVGWDVADGEIWFMTFLAKAEAGISLPEDGRSFTLRSRRRQ